MLVILSASEALILQETVRTLKDEINRLKGEQGHPNIKGKGQDNGNNPDHSSKKARCNATCEKRKRKLLDPYPA